MNQLQEKEFELLGYFVKVCEQLNIPYFLVCGSALGAVKYGGFIPWDDDIDVGLYREDYDRFVLQAQSLLPEGVFLQTYETDPAYPNIFAKLRNSKSTYIEASVSKFPINHGIYIDVFPLDGYPDDKFTQRKLECQKLWYKRLLSCTFSVKRSLKGYIATLAMRLAGIHKKTGYILKCFEAKISSFPIRNSTMVCNHGNWQGKLEYAPQWHYGEGAWANFEGLRVRVPEHYDAYLTQKYGDWRADLPADQRAGHHYYAVCDVTRPYTDYIEKLPNGKIRIKDHPTTCMQQEEPAT